MLAETTIQQKLLSDIENLQKDLSESNPLLRDLRKSAIQEFLKNGFPSRQHEEYKYLNLELVLKQQAETNQSNSQASALSIPSWNDEVLTVVLMNGSPNEKDLSNLKLPKGIIIESLSETIRKKNNHILNYLSSINSSEADAFQSINDALFQDGLFVYIEDKTKVSETLHIVNFSHGSTDAVSQPKIIFITGEDSSAKVVQTFLSGDSSVSLTNAVTEIKCGSNSELEWICIQQQNPFESLISNTLVNLSGRASFVNATFTLGGRMVRNNLSVSLNEKESKANLLGYYHPGKGQTFDNHTLVDHKEAHCESNELYKGVIDHDGTAIFNGKIIVRQHAQKTNAFQNNKNILLSDEASVNTKPQLEIYADDVKCSHGSSTGSLNPEELFYLRSRGISFESAKKLLLTAYAVDVLSRISSNALREHLQELILKKLD